MKWHLIICLLCLYSITTSENLALIINGALFKCVPVWIVNYMISLCFNVKLLQTVMHAHSFQFLTFYPPLCPTANRSCLHYSNGTAVLKATNHVHIVKSNGQFSFLIFLTFEQHLTQPIIPHFNIFFTWLSGHHTLVIFLLSLLLGPLSSFFLTSLTSEHWSGKELSL